MVAGDTFRMPDEAPLLQLYVVAPLAVKVAVWPMQMDEEETVTGGNGVTLTAPVASDEQPVVVPVTV